MTPKRLTLQPNEHDIETEGLPSSSGFDTEFRCRGKRALEARLPKEKEGSAAAQSGQRIHKALEQSDLTDLTDEKGNLTSEGRTASRIMYGESEIVHQYSFEGAHVTFEERIWDTDDELNHIWSGKVDRYDWQPDKRRLLVLDDKSGWTLPPAIHENWQLKSQGAKLTELLGAMETVVGLIHPFHPDTLWEAKVYTRAEMLDTLDTVRALVAEIQKPNQPRTPGGIQCQWCRAKTICPEYQATIAQLDQSVADEIQDQGFTAIIRRSIAERGEHVRLLKERYKNIEFILAQYVSLVEKDDGAVSGYRLARKTTRSITNEARAMELVRDAWGQDILTAAIKFNIVALEEELADKYGKRKAKEMARDLLRPVLVYQKGKNYLEESRSL